MILDSPDIGSDVHTPSPDPSPAQPTNQTMARMFTFGTATTTGQHADQGTAPRNGGSALYSTPSPGPVQALPPGPPRKMNNNISSSPQNIDMTPSFPGFAHVDAAQQQVSGTPSSMHGMSTGAHQAPPPRRVAMDDGKVRKISGRSSLHGGSPPRNTTPSGRGLGSGLPGFSPSRRSSRLAALAAASGAAIGNISGNTSDSRGSERPGVASKGNAGHHKGNAKVFQHQSQNRPDPADPPPPPVHHQVMHHAKLCIEVPHKRGELQTHCLHSELVVNQLYHSGLSTINASITFKACNDFRLWCSSFIASHVAHQRNSIHQLLHDFAEL